MIKNLFFDSTHRLYRAFSQGRVGGFTVPAFNLRIFTFEIASIVFRLAKKYHSSAFLFELAPTEIEYTSQSLRTYKRAIARAARQENYKHPIFLQGDHFKIKTNLSSEKRFLQSLIKKALQEKFFNIDIDASLLPIKENALVSAYFTNFIRKHSPKNVFVSIGAEVGVIGGKNTTLNEFLEFMKWYRQYLKAYKLAPEQGIVKIAVQTGTSHGGVMLSNGKIAVPQEDFKTLEIISKVAREYGLAGAVQHGASTLPDDFFIKIRSTGCCEIHLATVFQNIVFDSKYFPKELREKIFQWLIKNYSRRAGENDTQFFYRTRKYAIGRFKKEISNLPQKNRKKILIEIEKKLTLFFESLGIANTWEVIDNLYFDKSGKS